MLYRIFHRFIQFIDIRKGFDSDYLRSEIEESIELKGFNTWILICSAVLASIGLDTNSTAVIIGAMLVSPLMSPILGIGLGVGTLDRMLIFRSFSSLGLKVLAAFIGASLYYLISPFDTLTSEMDARTAPTILDVLIAFFGGIAGIVSMSQKKITNAIPGVAIATALMPPLCTSAYGFVHMDFRVMGGAFYLFFINAVFISLATLLVVRYFNVPTKRHLNVRMRYRAIGAVAFFLFVTILPSIYFLYQSLTTRGTESAIKNFINKRIEKKNIEVIKHKITKVGDNRHNISVYLYSSIDIADSIPAWRSQFRALGLKGYSLQIIKTNFSKSDWEEYLAENKEKTESERISVLNANATNLAWYRLKTIPDADYRFNHPKQIASELKAFLPHLEDMRFGTLIETNDSSANPQTDTLVVFYARKKAPVYPNYPAAKNGEEEKSKIQTFLKKRLETDSVRVWIDLY